MHRSRDVQWTLYMRVERKRKIHHSVNIASEILNKNTCSGTKRRQNQVDHHPLAFQDQIAFGSVEWTGASAHSCPICYLLVYASDYYFVSYLEITQRYWIKQLVLFSVRNESQNTKTYIKHWMHEDRPTNWLNLNLDHTPWFIVSIRSLVDCFFLVSLMWW